MHTIKNNEGSPQDLFNEGLMTIAEASRFICLSRSKIYQLMDNGKIRYCKIDGARRIPRNELIEFMSRNLRGGWNRD